MIKLNTKVSIIYRATSTGVPTTTSVTSIPSGVSSDSNRQAPVHPSIGFQDTAPATQGNFMKELSLETLPHPESDRAPLEALHR